MVMRITVYRSKYNWHQTIAELGVLDFQNQAIQEDSYYALKSFKIAQPDDFHNKSITALTVLPIVKPDSFIGL
jgi:hypothetical protein